MEYTIMVLIFFQIWGAKLEHHPIPLLKLKVLATRINILLHALNGLVEIVTCLFKLLSPFFWPISRLQAIAIVLVAGHIMWYQRLPICGHLKGALPN
ncbi:hypothetical protein AMTR_s00047p00151090 [Amborella trichopoda]|uniref:Uncharacterized protein n=1 Tax=Amborella trichopoda TaxID=13333 RepID=U5CWS6_AMBTC|nr:hypothetical protein AMTR_s00047p00151090 [Amborella trichopoda]